MSCIKTIIQYFLIVFLFPYATSAVIKDIKECSDILYGPKSQPLLNHVFLVCVLSENVEKCCDKINTDTDPTKNNLLSGCLCHEDFLDDMYDRIDENELAQGVGFNSTHLNQIFTKCGTFKHNKKHCPKSKEDKNDNVHCNKNKRKCDEDCDKEYKEGVIDGVKVKIETDNVKILNKHLDSKKEKEEKLTKYAEEIREPFSNFSNDKIAFNRKSRYYGQLYKSKFHDKNKNEKPVLLSEKKKNDDKMKVETLPVKLKYDDKDDYKNPYAGMGRVGYFHEPYKKVKAIISGNSKNDE